MNYSLKFLHPNTTYLSRIIKFL